MTNERCFAVPYEDRVDIERGGSGEAAKLHVLDGCVLDKAHKNASMRVYSQFVHFNMGLKEFYFFRGFLLKSSLLD